MTSEELAEKIARLQALYRKRTDYIDSGATSGWSHEDEREMNDLGEAIDSEITGLKEQGK